MNQQGTSDNNGLPPLSELFPFLLWALGLLCTSAGLIVISAQEKTKILQLKAVGPALFWAGVVCIVCALTMCPCITSFCSDQRNRIGLN